MKERVFGPLGMEHSEIVSRFPPDVAGAAISYLNAEKFEWPKRAVGATSQYSSIEDLMRWEEELRNVTIVSAETLDLALKGHVTDADVVFCEYGYGWQVCETEGLPLHQTHSGRHDGFRSGLYRAPSRGLAIAMVSNGAFLTAFGDLVIDVAYLYENEEHRPKGKALRGLEVER